MTTSSNRLKSVYAVIVALTAGFAASANAADITDVIDAMDKDVYAVPGLVEPLVIDDPYDFHVEPTFQQTIERAKITREWNCSASTSTRCANGDAILFNKEMRYERVRTQLDLNFEAAIFRDLSFSVNIPIVFSDQRKLKYAQNAGDDCRFGLADEDPRCVNDTNSTVDPSDGRIRADQENATSSDPFNTYRYFDLSDDPEEWTEGTDRGGLGDISFAINWAILNDTRYFKADDPWGRAHGRASLVIGMEWQAPTGETMRGSKYDSSGEVVEGNEGVGEGVHWLRWRIATSRRYQYLEPYMQFAFALGIPGDDTAFKDFEGGQERIGPGPRGGLTVGMEIIPWENFTEEYQQFFRIDLRGHYDFIGEGREYGPLFDHLNSSACNGQTISGTEPSVSNPNLDAACGWITEKWANAGINQVAKAAELENEYDVNHAFYEDGITSYEAYGRFGFGVNFIIQPIQYVQVRLFANMDIAQEHFITFGKAGNDRRGRTQRDPSCTVDCETIPSDNAPKDGTVSFDDVTERNPVYNPNYDSVGRRFRAEEFTIFNWGATLALQF